MSVSVIKVCGITNLDDATASVEGGATALGFNFYPQSKRYIAPHAAAAIARNLPPDILKIGVFVNAAPSDIETTTALVGLDIAQLHGDEKAEEVPHGVRVWKAYRVEEGFDSAQMDQFPAEAFLLDGPAGSEYGGGGKPFLWRLAAGSKHRIIIAGGLDASNVQKAIGDARPYGVDACSKLESAPGRKDLTKLALFLQAARQELE